MNETKLPSNEDSMLLIVRLWIIWPLACLLSAVIANPFSLQIQTGYSWGQWMYFTWLCELVVVCLFLLARVTFTSVKSIVIPAVAKDSSPWP